MRLKIGENEYELEESLSKASISDLILLKRATKTKDYPGVSIKSIVNALEDLKDPMDFLDSEEALETLRGMIFLCRRKAGEMGTLESLTDFPLSDMEFVYEDDELEDDEADEDPKVLDAAPDDQPPADE